MGRYGYHGILSLTPVAVFVIGIFVAFIGYETYRKSHTHELSVTLYPKSPINYLDKETRNDIRIYIHGKEVRNASIFSFRLQKIGPRPVRPEDYQKPIRFSVDPPGEIALVKPMPSNVGLKLTRKMNNAFELPKVLLNEGDEVFFQVVLKDDPEPWSMPKLNYDGRIAGIPNIKFKSYRDDFTAGFFVFDFIELLSIAILTISLLTLKLHLVGRRRPAFWTSRFIEIKIALLAFMTGATVFWFEKIIWHLVRGIGKSWWHFWSFPIIFGGIIIFIYYFGLFVWKPKWRH